MSYSLEESNDHIGYVCDELKDHLIKKNTDYNDAALNPQSVFAKLSPTDTIRVRIDDKLARMRRTSEAGKNFSEDTLLDLMGYLVLLRVANMREQADQPPGFEPTSFTISNQPTDGYVAVGDLPIDIPQDQSDVQPSTAPAPAMTTF